ncbi:MAG: DedA family protein [bacterium]|nr:DedA family protein [bacterium]
MPDFLVSLIEQYGYLAIFVITMLDHTGTPIAVLSGVGVATAGLLEVHTVLLVSFIGGWVGDVLLYGIGYYGGKHALRHFARRSTSVAHASEKISGWFDSYGTSVLIWGRFAAVIGKYLSVVAGSLEYPFIKFMALSFLGGLIMVLLFGVPTYFIGNELNAAFQNSQFTFYLTLGIIVVQLVGTKLWFSRKRKNQKI